MTGECKASRAGAGLTRKLPWDADFPLMLAPMQGLTNRAMRALMVEWVHPDLVFTEFVRVRPGSRRPMAATDVTEAGSRFAVEQVVQLIGRKVEALAAAAATAVAAGAVHLNLNLGCPFGRMTANSGGGALLREPAEIREILAALRPLTPGSLSVKTRAGFSDPDEIMSLLDIFAAEQVDFLILHPRTVKQQYKGSADHRITARVVAATPLPVIANGDIRTVDDAERVRELCRPAGLMLGRGALSDPLLFERIRGRAVPSPTVEERAAEIAWFLRRLSESYAEIFCGENQILTKLKAVVSHIRVEGLDRALRKLLRTGNLTSFFAGLDGLALREECGSAGFAPADLESVMLESVTAK